VNLDLGGGPAGGCPTGGDLAELVVFLASAANRNVSGELVREGSATGRSAHSG
jgi:hypothetical protein